MLTSTIYFTLGLLMLALAGGKFVDRAIRIAQRLGMSEALIGATLVSVGTTLPELLFSTTASFNGLSNMALGNAVGSVICNTGLIAGVLLAIRPVTLGPSEQLSVRRGSYWIAGLLVVYAALTFLVGEIQQWAGIALIVLFLCYAYQTLRTPQDPTGDKPKMAGSALVDVVILLVFGGFLYLGAALLVEHGPILAAGLGVPDRIIALTLVALGTSLPELVTSLVALSKGHMSLSLGNVLGANLLNLMLVVGVSGTIINVPLPSAFSGLELPAMAVLLCILLLPLRPGKSTFRWQGIALLGGYAGYLALLISKV